MEQDQFQTKQEFPSSSYPQMRYLIGVVMDNDRLERALKDVGFVTHNAAMKYVHIVGIIINIEPSK